MTDLFLDNYDGEMLFDMDNITQNSDSLEFDIKAQYDGKTVGMHAVIPIIVKRSLFKTIKYIKPNSQLRFLSIGEESDNLIAAFEQLLKPPYKSSGKFSQTPDAIDFSVQNRELYELDNDKIYIKLFNGEDQSDFEEDEKINLEMNFNFSRTSKRASLIEVRDGYSADLIAILMQ